MEVEEFKILVKTMKAVYTDPKFIPDKDAFDVWYSLLKDMDYKTASAALGRHMTTNRFPPTIADLRQANVSNNNLDEMNGEQAWSIVYKAMQNSAYGYQEEFNKLPPILQKCVGSPFNLHELALMDADTVNSVEKSLFLRTYETERKRKIEIDAMPEKVKQLILSNQVKGIEG